MKIILSVVLLLASAFAQAQVPAPASNYASSPIGRITTTDGKTVTITTPDTAIPGRPNNSAGGVYSMPPTTAFWINYAAIMKPYKGSSTIDIVVSNDPGTAGIDLSSEGQSGAFRTNCVASHMGRFDPIVAPGIPDYGHLHTYMGNSDITGLMTDQTLNNLDTFGRSTCAGGIGNRTVYWVPSVVDTRTGIPIKPVQLRAYYKNISEWRGTHPKAVVAPPPGLRFISGDPTATTDQDIVHWSCENDMGGTQHHIPTAAELAANPTWCSGGLDETITMDVGFAACWDGVNLDSPGHKSHMAQENYYTGCPSTHPIVLPQFEYKVDYTLRSLGGRAGLPYARLSSDNYPLTLPGGMSGHADWNGGWKREIMEAIVANCLHTPSDCGNNLIDVAGTNPHRILAGGTP